MDNVDKISSAVRLPRDTIVELWLEAKLNVELLRSCSLHDFHPIGPARVLGQKYICRHCLGKVDSIAKSWYEDGLAHARCDTVPPIQGG